MARSVTSAVQALVIPAGFPAPRFPEDNPWSEDAFQLGRHLFFDTRLSGNGTQACASCHEQKHAFADGIKTTFGSTGEPLSRNSQGLTNVAYNGTLTWANPLLTTIESQILVPLFGETPVELGAGTAGGEILERIQADPNYAELFSEAFPEDFKLGSPSTLAPGQDLTSQPNKAWDAIIKALATFVRGMISGNAPLIGSYTRETTPP